jgi:hypothetical protein
MARHTIFKEMRSTRLTDDELAAIKRERPGVRASLACEDIELTPEEEALFVQFDGERLTPDQRQERILEYLRRRPSPSLSARNTVGGLVGGNRHRSNEV